MTQVNACNCIICAKEFDANELHSLALSKINVTRFKICQSCLEASNPSEDYQQVREIISSYLWFAETSNLYKEAQNILEEIKKK